MQKCKLIIGLVFIWLLTACATKVVSSSEYLLVDTKIKQIEVRTTPAMSIQFMPITMANYLVGNEMVLVTQQGQVYRSKKHLWAEPLSPQLSRLTLQRLEKSLPNITWFGGQRLPSEAIAVLNVKVDSFYADLDGTIYISGRWQLLSSLGELMDSKTFNVTDTLKSDGYLTMVKTLSDAWFHKVINMMVDSIVKSL